MKKFTIIVVMIALFATITGCQPNPSGNGAQMSGEVKLGLQNGISYAPFYVMQQKQLLEKYLPGVTVTYQNFASGADVTAAMASNTIDAGILGSAPLLNAWEKSSIKMLSGLVCSPLSLLTMDKEVKSLKDIKATDKIAVPAPGSIQDIVLSMAAEKELNNKDAFDNNVVKMAHPEAEIALSSGKDIKAHYSSLPFLYREQNKGAKELTNGFDAFGGDFSFLVVGATGKFVTEKPLYAAAVYAALSEAIDLINKKDPSTIDIIINTEKMSKEDVIKCLDWEGSNFSTTPYGFIGLAKFMKEKGLLTKVPSSMSEISWPTCSAVVGLRAGAPSVVEAAQERK